MTVDYDNVPGNLYDKYQSSNPIARRLMEGFLASFDELVARANPKIAYEVGCGEGNLSMRLLRSGFDVRGSDLEESVVQQANNQARLLYGERFTVQNIYEMQSKQTYDLVLCCEVLEHLPDPDRALDRLKSMAAPWLLVSVPREPIWCVLNMMRGKYLSRLGNTPGHIQHWSTSSFLRKLKEHVQVVEVRRPLPWTMVLCRTR